MRTQTAVAELAAVGLPEYGAVPPPEVETLSQLLRRRGYFATNNLKTDYSVDTRLRPGLAPVIDACRPTYPTPRR